MIIGPCELLEYWPLVICINECSRWNYLSSCQKMLVCEIKIMLKTKFWENNREKNTKLLNREDKTPHKLPIKAWKGDHPRIEYIRPTFWQILPSRQTHTMPHCITLLVFRPFEYSAMYVKIKIPIVKLFPLITPSPPHLYLSSHAKFPFHFQLLKFNYLLLLKDTYGFWLVDIIHLWLLRSLTETSLGERLAF